MFPKILISFKKLQIFSGEISWNNLRSDLAVKWLSLFSIKSDINFQTVSPFNITPI